MVHLYSTFNQGALHCALHSHIHTLMVEETIRYQPAHREQLGVQSLAQGLFENNSGGARDQTGNPSGTLHVLMTASLPLSHAFIYIAYSGDGLERWGDTSSNVCQEQDSNPQCSNAADLSHSCCQVLYIAVQFILTLHISQ